MKQQYFQMVFLYFIFAFSKGFDLNVSTLHYSFQSATAYCVQDYRNSSSGAYFQNKLTKAMFKTVNGMQINQVNTFPMITFKKLECIGNEKVLALAQNNSIYEYDIVRNSISSFDANSVMDFAYVKLSTNSSQKIVYLSDNKIHIKAFPFNQNPNVQIYGLNVSVKSLRCALSRNTSFDGYCFLMPQNKTQILYFNVLAPLKVFSKTTEGYRIVEISQIKERVYIGYKNGKIKQYSLRSDKLVYEKEMSVGVNSQVSDIVINQLRNQMIFLNSESRVGIVSLSSGYETAISLITDPACSNTSQIVLLSQNSFAIINQIKAKIINSEQFSIFHSITSPQSHFQEICTSNQKFFNKNTSSCQSCQVGCNQCDQETSLCLECANGFFMVNDKCQNCKYASLSQQSYALCFQEKQINVLQITSTVAPVLAQTVQYTYSILSGSALLFLFIRFINFWSFVSVYYFLNINAIPYFLLELLSKIFNILYGSVFSFFGIDINSISMGINKKTNEKMEFTQISTDFVAANFESIVMFLYSLVLICVLYDAIKNWFKKFKIHIFEKVKLQACLEEFIGIFIPLLVPLSYFLMDLTSLNFLSKLNNGLFMLLWGIGSIFPFFYLILIVKRITLKQRLRMIRNEIKTKVILSNKLIEGKNQSKFQQWTINHIRSHKLLHISIDFVSQQECEKFLWCLNTFWGPFLVSFNHPEIFLFVIFLIETLALVNAFYAKDWRFNAIFEKSVLLCYHTCFIIMYICPSLYFSLSILASVMLICGGIHQLLSAIIEKLYFLFLVFKQRKISNKVAEEIIRSKKDVLSNFSIRKKSLQLNFHLKPQQQKFQRSSLTNFEQNVQGNTVPKRVLKKVRLIEGNYPVMKDNLRNKMAEGASIQQIDLTNHQFSKTEPHVFFSSSVKQHQNLFKSHFQTDSKSQADFQTTQNKPNDIKPVVQSKTHADFEFIESEENDSKKRSQQNEKFEKKETEKIDFQKTTKSIKYLTVTQIKIRKTKSDKQSVEKINSIAQLQVQQVKNLKKISDSTFQGL